MILEGIMTTVNDGDTTVNDDNHVNISPMGPRVDAAMRVLTLRPYQTSTTFANLRRTGQGVFHVTDDVLMMAQAAIGIIDPPPKLIPAVAVEGFVLAAACRWYALKVRSIDADQPRAEIVADVVDAGRLRDFFGLNRAKHAVVEAAILATRVELLSPQQILDEYDRLRVLVDKTGGPDEHAAFEYLVDYVRAAGDTQRLIRTE